MIQPEDIASLTDFKRDTTSHLRRLRKTGRPEVLTVKGKAALVVLDPAAYRRLAETVEEARTITGIKAGLEAFDRGEGLPARAALEAALRAKKSRRTPKRKPAA